MGVLTRPEQDGHWSLGGTEYPVCPHFWQGCWICCIMPGPRGRIMTWMPDPWQTCRQLGPACVAQHCSHSCGNKKANEHGLCNQMAGEHPFHILHQTAGR